MKDFSLLPHQWIERKVKPNPWYYFRIQNDNVNGVNGNGRKLREKNHIITIPLSSRDNKSRSSVEKSNQTSQQPYCIFLPVATCKLNKEKNFQGSNCILLHTWQRKELPRLKLYSLFLTSTTFTCPHTHHLSIKGTGNISVESLASIGSGYPIALIHRVRCN